MNLERYHQIILDFIHTETGFGLDLKPRVEFEDLLIKQTSQIDDDNYRINFEYYFDEDGFSIYEKTHKLVGFIILNSELNIIDWDLRETDTGIAAKLEKYVKK